MQVKEVIESERTSMAWKRTGKLGRCLASTLLLSLLYTQVAAESQLVHGWDCIVCDSNSMLAGNFGHTNDLIFNMSDTWWIDTIAKSYAAVALNDWLGTQGYNGTGEIGYVTVARALKAANPKIKILFYQASSWVSNNPYVVNQIGEHPEWWLKDDNGNVIYFKQPSAQYPHGHPMVDLTVATAQSWFADLSLTYFSNPEEAAKLCDGVFVDGAAYWPLNPNISISRYNKLFAGEMGTLQLAQERFTKLNGGEVWGNAALESHRSPYTPADVTWNTTLQHFNGAFEEMFGSFATQNRDGTWNVTLMEASFKNIIAASNAGHTVVIHAFPGPATVPFNHIGTPQNGFEINSWAGPVKAPTVADAVRKAAADRLVESLAPFLIVANERVFLSYAWFYNVEDGYIPCKAGVECAMPSEWYPEFTRPLGPPKGAALQNGTIWTREFEHASVYVDLRDRTACRITWS